MQRIFLLSSAVLLHAGSVRADNAASPNSCVDIFGAVTGEIAQSAVQSEGAIQAMSDARARSLASGSPSFEAFLLSGLAVSLDGGAVTTYTQPSGAFKLACVPPGVHIVEIQTRTFVYPTFKLSVPVDSSSPVQVVEYRYPGAPKVTSRVPLHISPVGVAHVYDERPKASIFAMLKSWNVIIMIVMGVLAFAMPAMMKNMSPETMAEMEDQQAAMGGGDIMSMFQNIMNPDAGAASTAAAAPARRIAPAGGAAAAAGARRAGR